MIASRIVFLTQPLITLPVFGIFLATSPNFHTLGLVMYLMIIGAATTLFAVWLYFRRPAERKWAAAIAATPCVFLTTPFIVVWLNGGRFVDKRFNSRHAPSPFRLNHRTLYS